MKLYIFVFLWACYSHLKDTVSRCYNTLDEMQDIKGNLIIFDKNICVFFFLRTVLCVHSSNNKIIIKIKLNNVDFFIIYLTLKILAKNKALFFATISLNNVFLLIFSPGKYINKSE